MSKKLLEDPKVATLVEKQRNAAVKEDRKRILEGLKEIKGEYAEETPADKRLAGQVVTAANKVVREAA